jgi:acetoin utilization deacetylase AcuC-like enzyme
MGFCLFNNVAVTAARLRGQGHRVAILDWDVHHGNGTQELLGGDPGTLFASIHQGGFYPFEGRVEDIHETGAATTVNVPLPAGTAGDVFRRAWGEIVLPVLGQFEPDWVLVSAGYDAHVDDPLADLSLTAGDYGWMAARLREVAPGGRVILALEGGYDLAAMEESMAATVRGLAGEGVEGYGLTSPPGSMEAFGRAAEAVARHWDI